MLRATAPRLARGHRTFAQHAHPPRECAVLSREISAPCAAFSDEKSPIFESDDVLPRSLATTHAMQRRRRSMTNSPSLSARARRMRQAVSSSKISLAPPSPAATTTAAATQPSSNREASPRRRRPRAGRARSRDTAIRDSDTPSPTRSVVWRWSKHDTRTSPPPAPQHRQRHDRRHDHRRHEDEPATSARWPWTIARDHHPRGQRDKRRHASSANASPYPCSIASATIAATTTAAASTSHTTFIQSSGAVPTTTSARWPWTIARYGDPR